MEKGFTSEWISELKANNDIVSVLSKYLTLNRKGKTFWACCPFHLEKTPSFAINDYEQFYHCFGCGASGDVIKFVQQIESVEFFEACKILADKANMKMPEFEKNSNLQVIKKQKEVALKILNITAKHYYANLKNPRADVAQAYLKKRGLDSDTVRTFGIGYSLGFREVIEHLKGKGFSESDIILSGVGEKKNQTLFDSLASRLVFPIINSYNDVLGFSARLLEKADFAKYKNTAQTVVFDKSKCVYSINNIKKLKQSGELKQVLLVEGQMDVISLYKNGVKNAVACMGTALTLHHAREIKRFCDKVVVCFDGDEAGKKATLRSLDILVNAGLSVFVTTLPKDSDPDSFVLQFGKEQFEKLVEESYYWVEFLIRHYESQYDLTKLEQKKLFVSDALNVVKKLSTDSEKDIYMNLIKEISNITMSVLLRDLNEASQPENKEPNKQIDEKLLNVKENSYVKAAKFVIASLLHKRSYASLNPKILDGLVNSNYIQIYEYIVEKEKMQEKVLISNLFQIFDVDNNNDVYEVINFEFDENQNNESYYLDCVKTLIAFGWKMKKDELVEKISSEADLDKKKELYKQMNEIILKSKGI